MLMKDNTWLRSDDSICGTYSEIEDKMYMNFKFPEEDRRNEGIYKGFRVFHKVEAESL